MKLFSILKDPSTWNSLNLVDFRLPTIPQAYKNKVDSLLSFINKQLDEENAAEIPRGDYKEFLELAKIFMGRQHRPQERIHLPAELAMAFFIVFPYLESWFCSPSLLGAAENDLKLFKRLQKFSKINKKISSAPLPSCAGIHGT